MRAVSAVITRAGARRAAAAGGARPVLVAGSQVSARLPAAASS